MGVVRRLSPRVAALAFLGGALALTAASRGVTAAPQRTHASAAPAAVRRATAVVRFDADGVSEPVSFEVPPATRSVTMVVEGRADQLYGLASLETADGVEHVQRDRDRPVRALMEASYYVEKSGTLSSDLSQSIRLGTFTAVYPYAPGQVLAPGRLRVRVASTAVQGSATVTVLMPPDDGSRTLHINVIDVSDYPVDDGPPSFLLEARAILGKAGIEIVLDERQFMRRTGFSNITEWTEPQESPVSPSARLAREGRRRVSSEALNIFVVDSLPKRVFGLTLGTPGPPLSSSRYYGVVLRRVASSLMAQVFAHELSHYLGLQHPVFVSVSGTRYPDALPDTEPGTDNLMEGTGTLLTAGQAFVLSRSALLRPR